jgi:hypothetical protein
MTEQPGQSNKDGFLVRWVHTGKFEAIYHISRELAENYDEAVAYVEAHRLELEPIDVFPLSDDYKQFL